MSPEGSMPRSSHIRSQGGLTVQTVLIFCWFLLDSSAQLPTKAFVASERIIPHVAFQEQSLPSHPLLLSKLYCAGSCDVKGRWHIGDELSPDILSAPCMISSAYLVPPCLSVEGRGNAILYKLPAARGESCPLKSVFGFPTLPLLKGSNNELLKDSQI